MDSQKALTFINKLLANDKQVLNDLEQKLFLGMWEGKEYAEIVNDGFYSTQYVRDVGAKLCTKITELLGIQVKKRIFKNSIIAGYQKFSEQASLSQRSSHLLLWGSHLLFRRPHLLLLMAYLLKLRGSSASLSPSPSKLNASTVSIISTAGGQISQGCNTKIEALLARDNILPQEGSGC